MAETNEITESKPYELRALCSKDVFPMFKIISKIGISDFKKIFEQDNLKSMVAEKANAKALGVAIVSELAVVVCDHISECEQEIYQLLSNLSGMSKKDIENLGMVTFFEMIIDVFKKEEFKDFISVVSKLFK